MIRKICPVCEQTMTRSHYCKNCRQFVKTPYLRDITYYLNESHPKGERDCDYHGIHEKQGKADRGKPAPANRTQQWSGAAWPWGSTGGRGPGNAEKRADRKAKRRKPWYLFLGIVVLAELLGVAGKWIARIAIPAKAVRDEDFKLLSDQEVQSRGLPCSSNGHYSLSGEAMAGEMEAIIEMAGYAIGSVETSSWNYADTGGEDEWTDFETSVDYFVELSGGGEEGEVWDSVTVNYDTATGQLHGVTIYTSQVSAGAFMAGKMVEFLQEQGEIPDDEAYGELVKGDILKYSDREEGEEETGNWRDIPGEGDKVTEVYFHETDGAFYVRIWKGRD